MEALLIIKIHVLHIEISVSIRALPISCAHNRPVLRKILVPADQSARQWRRKTDFNPSIARRSFGSEFREAQTGTISSGMNGSRRTPGLR